MARWDSHRHLFLWNYTKNVQNFLSRVIYGHFRVCGQHYKSIRWFLCTTYDLNHVIEYHKGDKILIWAIFEPIRGKSIIFYDFAKLRQWRFSFLAITRKVKGLELLNHAASETIRLFWTIWSGKWALYLVLKPRYGRLKVAIWCRDWAWPSGLEVRFKIA